MSYQPVSLRQEQKPALSQKQAQSIIMSPRMQQSIRLLQLPILEIEQLIEEELMENPLLERVEEEEGGEERLSGSSEEVDFSDETFEAMGDIDDSFESHFQESDSFIQGRNSELERARSYYEESISKKESLHEELLLQARERCETGDELEAAACIIGNLEENGFFTSDIDELSLLHGIERELLQKALILLQSLDPPGIGATNMQENLLIQLERKDKSESLAYKIVKYFYGELLQNKITLIAKGLKKKEADISAAVNGELIRLDLRPGAKRSGGDSAAITPDIEIFTEDKNIEIRINDEWIPELRLSKEYLKMAYSKKTDANDQKYLKQKISSAKWLMKNLSQRNDTLERVTRKLVENQQQFFREPNGELVPLKMKCIAEELGLHESTVARAVSSKYLSCDRGVFPLRYFFTNALSKDGGDEMSTNAVKELLKSIIAEEDKNSPLSDAALSRILMRKGVYCARRTVAKYRRELKIGSTRQRKQFH